MTSPLQFTTQREALYTNMSSNLGVILGTNVPQILRNLSTAIQNTQIRVIGIDIGGVVRALLQGLLNTLLSTVTSALNNLATVQEQMADAAVLGATDVQIYATFGPGQLSANWTANFSASVLKAKPTDINLLNFSAKYQQSPNHGLFHGRSTDDGSDESADSAEFWPTCHSNEKRRHGGQPPTATKAQLQLGFYGSMIPAIVRKMASQGQTIHQLGQWHANIASCRIKGSAWNCQFDIYRRSSGFT